MISTCWSTFCWTRDMQRGSDLNILVGDDPVDSCLLQFWPADGTDRIVRRGSEIADY